MVEIDEQQVVEIRESIHALSNALNTMSMQAELVRMLAADSQSSDKIDKAIDIVTAECKKSGKLAHEIGAIVKSAAGVD